MTIKVKIIAPKKWNDRVFYETLEDYTIGGFTIPKGFTFDGASVPRIMWSIFPPIGKYTEAALLHDYLLYTKDYTWDECTKFFEDELVNLGISKWRIYVMVWAVKFNGKIKKLIGKDYDATT